MGPTLHHRAVGIHPGAFVQNTPPLTIDVQDHVLWVDTSTAAPYQLKVWDQTSATWLLVGRVTEDGGVTAIPPSKPEPSTCCVPTPPVTPGGGGAGHAPGGFHPDRGSVVGGIMCGVASAMATQLEADYDRFRQLYNGMLNAVSTGTSIWSLDKIRRALINTLFGGGRTVSFNDAILNTLVAILYAALPGNVAGLYPPLSSAMNHALLCSLFTALPKDGSAITVNTGTILNWQANYNRTYSYIKDYNQAPLWLIAFCYPISYWQQIAHQGSQSPSTACAICGLNAMTGGVKTGITTGGSLTGGADLRVSWQSMTGGAMLHVTDHGALTGGATWRHPLDHAISGGASIT